MVHFKSIGQFLIFFLLITITYHWMGTCHAQEISAEFLYDSADQAVSTHTFDDPMVYEGDVVSTREGVWFAWLKFTPGEGDRIWMGLRDGDEWIHQTEVTPYPGQYKNPTLTVDASQRMWLSYEKEVEGHWDIYLHQYDREKQALLKEKRISESNDPDINHQIAADSEGGLWLVWQSGYKGQFDILARRVQPNSQHFIQRVSTPEADDWQPDVAVTEGNQIHVVWDVYDGESFNVRYRRWQEGAWGEIADLASTAAFEGRAQVVEGERNRVWVAYEEGSENWGKHYYSRQGRGEPRGYYEMDQKKGPLHTFRSLRILSIAPNESGTLQQNSLIEPLPMPSIEQALQRENRPNHVDRMGAFYERAQLCRDSSGRIWVMYRHYYAPWMGIPDIMYRSHIEDGFKVYARCLSNQGWSKLYGVDYIQGDGMQRLRVAPHQDGMAAVWSIGRTDRRASQDQRERGIAWAMIDASTIGKAPGKALLTSPSPLSSKIRQIAVKQTNETVEVNGETYQLFYGDLHRHTDLSLCRVPLDGSIEDAYRYAIDAAELDFLGITDHSRDIALGDHLSQLWWRNRKEVNRHHLLSKFFPYYAFERSHGNTADHNVVSLDGDILRPHTYPVPEFWHEFGSEIITIPHQPIRRDTWKYQDDIRRPLMEIFQGCRTQSIEDHAHEGLAKGYHIGFIASSDHMSTSGSYACVWAEERNRQSIFHALQHRRTFGATAKISLLVRAGEHWMGEIVEAETMPPITIEAKGTAPIKTIQFVVDGEIYKTINPNQSQISLEEDLGIEGKHYVYVFLEQEDGHRAWSSPIWFEGDFE